MELWDVYNPAGERTGKIKPKGSPWEEEERHLAVEIWLADGERRLLFEHRSPQCEVYPCVWALTAGRAVAGEDSAAACLREAKEELGLSLKREELQFLRRIIRSDYIWEIYLVQRPTWPQELTLQPEEVDAVDWLTPSQLRQRMAQGSVFVYPEMAQVLAQVEERLEPVTLRPALPRDAEDITQVLTRSWQWAYGGLLPQPLIEAVNATRPETIPHRLEQPGGREFCICRAGRTVGFLSMGPGRDEGWADWWEIRAFYLLPEEMGRGVGPKAMAAALEAGRAAGYRRAYLWVLESNVHARRFYGRCGFLPNGDQHLFAWQNWQRVEMDGALVSEVRCTRPL